MASVAEQSELQRSGTSAAMLNDSCNISRKITTRVNYLEIYNENVNDLLDPAKRNLYVWENRDECVIVE